MTTRLSRRLAVAGSISWPTTVAWEAEVTEPIWSYLTRMPEDSTLYLRHGDAAQGPDNIAHRWYVALTSGLVVNPRPDVRVVEEPVPADWENCAPWCKPLKANGEPHRRPNPGYPGSPRRGNLADYCPAAGHRRNPNVVGFHMVGDGKTPTYTPLPDVQVNVLYAFILNDSPGTTSTVQHAQRNRVPHRTWSAYT